MTGRGKAFPRVDVGNGGDGNRREIGNTLMARREIAASRIASGLPLNRRERRALKLQRRNGK